MRPFIAGVILTLLVLAGSVFAVSRLGLYPIGADNPPSGLERALAARAMDVYADKHKPEMENPTQLTADNLTEGAKEYEEHCAFCHGGAKSKISPMQNKFSPPVPQLISRIPHDPDNWLFWVTKHGVRMTGMGMGRDHVGRGDLEGHRLHQTQRQATGGDGDRVAEPRRGAGRN